MNQAYQNLEKIRYIKSKATKPGGYSIVLIEPNVVAVKGSTYILYDPSRRSIAIESPNPNELLLVSTK